MWTKRLLRRIHHWQYSVTGLVLANVVVLGIMPYIYLLWITLKLVTIGQPDAVRQKGQDFVFATLQRLVLFFYEHVTGAQVTLYGDLEQVLHGKEQALYLSNHQSAVDWVVVDMLAARATMLGQVRYILKSSIKYIPYFGHTLYSQGCIYVKHGHLRLEKLTAALEYLHNPDIKSWIVVFPEGTRYNLALEEQSNLIERTRQYSIASGLQPLRHLLLPRWRGLWLTIATLRPTFDAIYDVTIVYEGTRDPETGQRHAAPAFFEFMTLLHPKIHLHVRRINMRDVPTDKEAFKDWLYELFLQKDRLLESYYGKMGAKNQFIFGCKGTSTPLSKWQTWPTAVFSTILLVTPFLFSSFLRQYYLWLWLAGVCFCYAITAFAEISSNCHWTLKAHISKST